LGTFTIGDIVLFPFPYIDLTKRKLRPCLVISQEMKEDIILCQITSKNIQKDKYTIEIKKDETSEGSLMLDSYIRTNMIFTATREQIHKKLCKMHDTKYKLVTEKISEKIKK